MSESLITPIEELFAALPMGTSPLGRVVLCGGVGAAFAYFVRPSMSFEDNGNPRPFILTDAANPQATVFPYWAYVVVPAFVFGVLL